MNINNILSGWKGLIIKDPATEMIAIQRAKICQKCNYAKKSTLSIIISDSIKDIKGYKCDLCQCPLSPKIRSKKEKCPKNLW